VNLVLNWLIIIYCDDTETKWPKNENMKNSDATYKTEFKWIKLFNGIRALLQRWKDSLIEKDDVVNYGLQLRLKSSKKFI